MSKKNMNGVNVVKVDVVLGSKVVNYDHSATGGYVGQLTHTVTTITARDASGRSVASETHMGSHSMTTSNYTAKLKSRVQKAGGSWMGRTLDQEHAALDAKMDAAYAAGGETLRAYKDAEFARLELQARGELNREGLRAAGKI